ncbi:hypothetical protein A5759_06885 [Mycobacterium sp. 852014-52144_SCH5372336]|nr:hypothetical protein A5759_06885 [Mycobacterium sp. 852014-52144_SCH5372336]
MGVTAGAGGSAYLTTADDAAATTSVHVITSAGISDPFVIPGYARGGVVVAPNGTAYQLSEYSSGLDEKSYISTITPTGVVTKDFDGEFGYFGSGDSLQVAADGTGYVVIFDYPSGPVRWAVAHPDGEVTLVPQPAGTDVLDYTFEIGPDNKLYAYSFFDPAYTVSPAGATTILPNSSGALELEFGPTGTPFIAQLSGSSTQFVNISTGAESATIPGGNQGDFDRLTIGSDGTVFVKAYAGTNPGDTAEVSVLAGTAAGATIASFTDLGNTAYVTPAGGGVGYVTVYDIASDTTKVWKLSSNGAEQLDTFSGMAVGGVAFGGNGKLYLTTSADAQTQLHILDA